MDGGLAGGHGRRAPTYASVKTLVINGTDEEGDNGGLDLRISMVPSSAERSRGFVRSRSGNIMSKIICG